MQGRDFTRKTKIVATLGPASIEPEILKKIIQAGATTLRLNFSHGSHEYHQQSIRLIRQVAYELDQPVGILQDLQGPKIRLGKFKQPLYVNTGDSYILTSREVECNETIGCISYEYLAEEVPEGSRILLDDGRVEMKVEKIDKLNKDLYCRVVVGGYLSSNKGVNFPGVYLSVKALTKKDKEDLTFGLDQGVDWVALSFVRNPQDVIEIKEIIASAGKSVPVIVKIEKHEAIEQMEEILSLCDGVMVARGDLGVELPPEDVPVLQKRLIATSNRLGIPVITATQMLDSMEKNPRPTRAEVSDVANAILDGTDAVMLSGETAVGKYPVEAVTTMATIAQRMEQELMNSSTDSLGTSSIPNAISAAVSHIAKKLKASAIMPLTKTGSTARNVSKFRPQTPILAITPHMNVARQLQLVWGVKPLLVLDLANHEQTLEAAVNIALEKNLLSDGDLVVMTAGTVQGIPGLTDYIKVHNVKAILAKGTGIGQKQVKGKTKLILEIKDLSSFTQGDILVTNTTNAQFVEAIKKAGAIITEEEGINSHGAKIGLRLGIPVVVGVKNATQILRDGTYITVDAERGLIQG